jgi:hypothetical protein
MAGKLKPTPRKCTLSHYYNIGALLKKIRKKGAKIYLFLRTYRFLMNSMENRNYVF